MSLLLNLAAARHRASGPPPANDVSFIAFANNMFSTATSASVVIPTAHAVGDLLIGVVMSQSPPTTSVSGWTLVAQSGPTGASSPIYTSIFKRVSTESGGGVLGTWNQTPSGKISVSVVVFRGSTGTPSVLDSTTATTTDINVTTVTPPVALSTNNMLFIAGSSSVSSVATTTHGSIDSAWTADSRTSFGSTTDHLNYMCGHKKPTQTSTAESGVITLDTFSGPNAWANVGLLIG